jgi:hypothetical protein
MGDDDFWKNEDDSARHQPLPGVGSGTNRAANIQTGNGYDATVGVSLNDFYAYMPLHSYIYAPCRELWPGASVNARVPPIPVFDAGGRSVIGEEDGKPVKMKASAWLDRNKPVEQMTWAPGMPMILEHRLILEGGWIERNGVSCFNLYRPPSIKRGDPSQAGRWLDLVRKIFPEDVEHIVKWFAHRVQHPEDKINHAIVLGGKPGIGKDTVIEPVKRAVGPWNVQEVSPKQTIGRFNGFLKSVILRISEASDLGELDRFQFYEHLKAYTAAPPDILRVDEKHLREYAIPNCCGVIITTNHKVGGIYLPREDRRHYVAWSQLPENGNFSPDFWTEIHDWYNHHGGASHVAAYLANFDLSDFNPKAPPPKTQAFWEIVDASRAPEDAELTDVLDTMRWPDTASITQIAAKSPQTFCDWLLDRKNSRRIPHRLEDCGYVAVRNAAARDGLWKIDGKRQVIYAKAELAPRDRIAAAMKWAGY